MGNALTQAQLHGFLDELESLQKEAGWERLIPSFLRGGRGASTAVKGTARAATSTGEKGWRELGKRVKNPIYGMREGWKDLSPMRGLNRAQRIKKVDKSGFKIPLTKTRVMQAGEHMKMAPKGFGKSYRKSGVKGVAEEASRTGWTGQGKITKYLPVGQKGMIAGFGGLGAYNTATAPEGQRMSTALGEIGGTAGWIASGGLSMLPSAASWIAPGIAGSVAGGKIDKMMASKKLKQLGLTPKQIGGLSGDQVTELLQYHRQNMGAGQ